MSGIILTALVAAGWLVAEQRAPRAATVANMGIILLLAGVATMAERDPRTQAIWAHSVRAAWMASQAVRMEGGRGAAGAAHAVGLFMLSSYLPWVSPRATVGLLGSEAFGMLAREEWGCAFWPAMILFRGWVPLTVIHELAKSGEENAAIVLATITALRWRGRIIEA